MIFKLSDHYNVKRRINIIHGFIRKKINLHWSDHVYRLCIYFWKNYGCSGLLFHDFKGFMMQHKLYGWYKLNTK